MITNAELGGKLQYERTVPYEATAEEGHDKHHLIKITYSNECNIHCNTIETVNASSSNRCVLDGLK